MDIKISKKEVLRYLGYRNQILSPDMENLIDITIDEAYNIIKPRYVYRYFEILSKDSSYLGLKDTNVSIKGKDISAHLSGSKECYIMAVTLGIEIDKKIRYYEHSSITKAMILDACATTAVESACDIVCSIIKNDLKKGGFTITRRYSPGYGDFDINIQREILNIVDAEKLIGLTATRNNILIPRKSVTAVVGVIDEELDDKTFEKCKACPNYSKCAYRKEGDVCGS